MLLNTASIWVCVPWLWVLAGSGGSVCGLGAWGPGAVAARVWWGCCWGPWHCRKSNGITICCRWVNQFDAWTQLRLRDPVCSWRWTAHEQFSMDFELTPLVLSNTKNSVQCQWIWRDLVTNVLYDGQCRAWQSHLKISLAVVILQRRKVVRCVQFYLTTG